MSWGDKNNGGGPEKGPWGNHSGGNGGWGGKPSGGDDLDAILRDVQNRIKRVFGGGGAMGGGMGGKNNRTLFGLVAGGIFVFWLLNGFYLVQPDEQAAVQRFGKFVRVSNPGLRYALPYPIEQVTNLKVTTINRLEKRNTQEESLMITGDENLVDIHFEVQWRIKDIETYLFNMRSPEETVRLVAESVVREVIGKTPITPVLAEGRLQIEIETRDRLQETINTYNAGIEIVRLQLQDVKPPAAVLDAFADVQNARTEKDSLRNQAESYRNDIIPRARGDAERLIQEAEAYKKQVIADAKGEAEQFKAVYEQYKFAKGPTRQRIYLQTMEEVLGGMDKVIIDSKGSQGVLPYMALPELGKKAPAPSSSTGGSQ